MGIYTKSRIKITVGTVLISLGVILGLWGLLFVTDYIMFVNNKPIIFSATSIEEINGEYITIEKGLGYYVITSKENVSELYLLGEKIK